MICFLNISLKTVFLTLTISSAMGFNISPQPNAVFKQPFKNQTRSSSSYFGFAINLRESGLFIGAPRAQESGTMKEYGAIYKCSIKTGNCELVPIDRKRRFVKYDDIAHGKPKKDHQWLGASMDGGDKDTDKLVVCAPRLEADWKTNTIPIMHGICYWTSNTLNNETLFYQIAPLRAPQNQFKRNGNSTRYYHSFGQQGLSVHVTSDDQEILMGAPGIDTWKGSIIRYYPQTNQGLYRRAEIPNPESWNQDVNSYFGYSVGSGYFNSALPNKIYYLASAPQANLQSGEAYLFDIVKTPSGEDTIKKYFTFRGSQFGEYFGYAVLAEDFNNDGLTDVIVTAPLYSSGGHVDQGAMYVFINKGKFVFELQKKIISPIEGRGRFGSSISKLGDINRDGFNDIAVGAPFTGNGTVFIYLGSSKGLREVHSQKLEGGPVATSWGSPMFGHGLSKGSDIDNNGFNDFAIGAPNAESVFVYRSYPVVKIHATINSLSREIKPDQTKFQIKICYMITTKSKNILVEQLTIRVIVDPRVTLKGTDSFLTLYLQAFTQEECRLLGATATYTPHSIYTPMKLEMFYQFSKEIPNSKEFCGDCVAVDPTDPKSVSTMIAFSTGCVSDICVADLEVTSSGLCPTYTLGSSRTMSVIYDITNSGERAYLPQINITSSNKMPFAKLPSLCNQHDDVLLCDLTQGQPMMQNEKQNITIVYDVSRVEGSSITLTAEVFSNGKERNPFDNIVRDYITLREFTEIEVIGKPLTPHIKLEEVFHSAEIINSYEVKSNGPSKIQELEIALHIPIAQKFHESSEPVPFVNVTSITVQGTYNSQLLNMKVYQDNTMLLLNATQISSTTTQKKDRKDKQEFQKNISEELGKGSSDDEVRRRRSRCTIEQPKYNNDSFRAVQKRSYELLSFEHMESLPVNRTIVFSCVNPETTSCARAVIRVNDFIPDMPITVTLKYHVDLDAVNKILIEPWEYFAIDTRLDIVKVGDTDGNSTHLSKNLECNIISRKHIYHSPLFVMIILGILGGILSLAAIVYGMHKAGFFKRKLKEEMTNLINEQEAEDTVD